MRNKIFCVGDGYGQTKLWPQWPMMVDLLMPDREVEIFSPAGAGPEIMVEYLLHQGNALVGQTVIIEWSNPDRLDKLISPESVKWLEIAISDPVYKYNFVTLNDGSHWWLSSDSTRPEVLEYHEKTIDRAQAVRRMFNYVVLMQSYLKDHNVKYVSTSLEEMYTYYKYGKHAELFRTNKVGGRQPQPIVHFDFVVERLLPNLEKHISADEIDFARCLVTDIDWRPFDEEFNNEEFDKIKTKLKQYRESINN